MRVIYTCPVCGADLHDTMLCSNPPIHKKVCLECGWESEGDKEDVVRIPYGGNKENSHTKWLGDGWSISTSEAFISTPCKNCPNHPSNGGSGFCDCTLGTLVSY